jgi:uncharacterized protein YuzE
MKIEYDGKRDLLYIWFGMVGTKSAQTVTISPGVHADFDGNGKLIGLEVLDAKEVLGTSDQLEISLPSFVGTGQ